MEKDKVVIKFNRTVDTIVKYKNRNHFHFLYELSIIFDIISHREVPCLTLIDACTGNKNHLFFRNETDLFSNRLEFVDWNSISFDDKKNIVQVNRIIRSPLKYEESHIDIFIQEMGEKLGTHKKRKTEVERSGVPNSFEIDNKQNDLCKLTTVDISKCYAGINIIDHVNRFDYTTGKGLNKLWSSDFALALTLIPTNVGEAKFDDDTIILKSKKRKNKIVQIEVKKSIILK